MKTKKFKHLKIHTTTHIRKNMFTKSYLFLLALFTYLSTQGQITVNGNAPFKCRSTIILQAPNSGTNLIYKWVASGPVHLRKPGTKGNGTNVVSIVGNNQVELIVKGNGDISLDIFNGNNLVGSETVAIKPSNNDLNPTYTIAHGSLQAPNKIQTHHPWIPINASPSGTPQTITVTNHEPFDILWSVGGGVTILNKTTGNVKVGSKYQALVTLTSDGTTNKGFIRGSFIDSCTGLCGNSTYFNWEILKTIQPNNIDGVVCLRDDNLDNSKTTIYSIPDEFAGNAIFEWSILNEDNTPFDPSILQISSGILYGNAATVKYLGNHTPSTVGNFKIRATNVVGRGTNKVYSQPFQEKVITAAPKTPTTKQTTYCASANIGATTTISIPNPQLGISYTWSQDKDSQGKPVTNWKITPNANGTSIDIVFNDTKSGILHITGSNSNSDGTLCNSASTIVYINRDSADNITITGPSCIPFGSTDTFTFTATPFARYNWDTSSLPSNWLVQNNGNSLVIRPDKRNFTETGDYSISASLAGNCNSNTSSNYSFSVAPNTPTIQGETCAGIGENKSYTITSVGASTALVTFNGSNQTTVNLNGGTGTFNFALQKNTTIKVITSTSNNCNSTVASLNINAKPIVTSITHGVLGCGNTPVTFKANTNGTATNYKWRFPKDWTEISRKGNTITLNLNNTSGEIGVTPSSNSCIGNETVLNAVINSLDIDFDSKSKPFHIIATPRNQAKLIMNWFFTTNQNDLNKTLCTGGTPFEKDSNPRASAKVPAIPNLSDWVRLEVTDPTTGCTRCYVLKITNFLPRRSAAIQPNKSSFYVNTNLVVKAYPNPVSTILNVEISTKESIQFMALVNPQGKIVHQKTKTNHNETIEVTKYPKGIYLLYVLTKKGYITKKVIIK